MVAAKILKGRTTLLEGKTCPVTLAKQMLQTDRWPHPDCLIYSPSGKSQTHTIESLLEMRQEAYRQPHSASTLLLIVEHADRMPPLASQTLLKILEEPPATTTFVLIAENKHKLLPTILSRCHVIKVGGEEKGEHPLKEATLGFLAKGKFTSLYQMQDSIESLLAYFDEEDKRHEHVALFCSMVLTWYRDMELLSIDAHSDKLLLPEWRESISRGERVDLDKLFKAIKDAKLSFDRFTTPKQILESLFLTLGIL